MVKKVLKCTKPFIGACFGAFTNGKRRTSCVQIISKSHAGFLLIYRENCIFVIRNHAPLVSLLMEKILICAPTHKSKNYCAEKWLSTLQTLTYPNFEVIVFDNTNDGGANAEHLNHLAAALCVSYHFTAVNTATKKELLARITEGHNHCRAYALGQGYKHMLHLETDVMPERDVIERLLAHKKAVVGALYYRDEGKSRKLMVQRHIYRAHNNIFSDNLAPGDDVCFIDGTLKKVSHVGLGCVMIDVRVLQAIPFRSQNGIDKSADTYFAEDLFRSGIKIWADTSLICEHQNQAWGNFGVDYN